MAAAETPDARNFFNASTLHPAFMASLDVIPGGNPDAIKIDLGEKPAPFNSSLLKPPSYMACAVNPAPRNSQASKTHTLSSPASNPAVFKSAALKPAFFNFLHSQTGFNCLTVYPLAFN